MRIAVLARGLTRPGGVSRLLSGLVRNLPAASGDDEFVILTDASLERDLTAPNAREVVLGPANAALFDHFKVARAVKRIEPDVFVATKNAVPRGVGCPVVCIFLDLAYFAMPEAYRTADNIYMRAMLKRSARLAARIVAISDFTRREVGRWLTTAAMEKTRVVYPGLDETFHVLDESELEDAAARLPDLPRRFVLYPGNISPRKNLARLLEAFGTVDREVGLVLTGHRTWKSRALAEPFGRLGRSHDVRLVGPQSDRDLAALYNLAEAVCYPSLYEGFGFPVLEGFGCGAPVAASSAASIPEVAGDAALLFDACDTESISGALDRLLRDEGLKGELKNAGLRRASEFSWKKTAEGLMAVIREVA